MFFRISILVLTALLWAGCADSAGTPYRGNDGRTGEYGAMGVSDLEQIVWKHRSPAAAAGPPTVGSDAVFVVSVDGTVTALEASDGTVRWETKLDSPTYGTAVIAGRRLLIGTDGGLVAVGLDGEVQWSLDGPPIEAAPLVVDSVAYVGNRGGTLLAIDAVGGSLIWEAVTAGPIIAPAVKCAGNVVVGSGDGGIYSLDPSTGEPKWAWSAGAPVRGLAASGDKVFATAGSRLMAIDSGAPEKAAWRGGLGSIAETPPSLTGGVVVAGTAEGQLVGLDATDGSPLFRKELGSAVRGDIAVTGERLVVSTARHGLQVVDRAGKEVWEFRTDGSAVGVTPATNRVYVADTAGSVYALE